MCSVILPTAGYGLWGDKHLGSPILAWISLEVQVCSVILPTAGYGLAVHMRLVSVVNDVYDFV